ncbi:MAG: regulatory protein TetR [Mycobacterium sp.]|nr:regulatory protein TetR [Mycobacterium sp.]
MWAASPVPSVASDESGGRPLVARAAARSLSGRMAAATQEVEQLVEATYRIVSRDGTVDPRVRDILLEAGLSTQAFYRHFRSKDDLLLVLLDDGRRRLADYLGHRMGKARNPEGKLRAWISGMLAQAADPEAAERTRPFLVGLPRLRETFPAEHAESEAVLIGLLVEVIAAGVESGTMASAAPERDALAIYQLTLGAMEAHLFARTTPTRAETTHVVDFALRAVRP